MAWRWVGRKIMARLDEDAAKEDVRERVHCMRWRRATADAMAAALGREVVQGEHGEDGDGGAVSEDNVCAALPADKAAEVA